MVKDSFAFDRLLEVAPLAEETDNSGCAPRPFSRSPASRSPVSRVPVSRVPASRAPASRAPVVRAPVAHPLMRRGVSLLVCGHRSSHLRGYRPLAAGPPASRLHGFCCHLLVCSLGDPPPSISLPRSSRLPASKSWRQMPRVVFVKPTNIDFVSRHCCARHNTANYSGFPCVQLSIGWKDFERLTSGLRQNEVRTRCATGSGRWT